MKTLAEIQKEPPVKPQPEKSECIHCGYEDEIERMNPINLHDGYGKQYIHTECAIDKIVQLCKEIKEIERGKL